MSSDTITPHSQFAVRWSTAPALVGYADHRDQSTEALADLMASKPDYRGTARGVLAYIASLRDRTGSAFRRDVITHVATGREISADELRNIVADRDYART